MLARIITSVSTNNMRMYILTIHVVKKKVEYCDHYSRQINCIRDEKDFTYCHHGRVDDFCVWADDHQS